MSILSGSGGQLPLLCYTTGGLCYHRRSVSPQEVCVTPHKVGVIPQDVCLSCLVAGVGGWLINLSLISGVNQINVPEAPEKFHFIIPCVVQNATCTVHQDTPWDLAAYGNPWAMAPWFEILKKCWSVPNIHLDIT